MTNQWTVKKKQSIDELLMKIIIRCGPNWSPVSKFDPDLVRSAWSYSKVVKYQGFFTSLGLSHRCRMNPSASVLDASKLSTDPNINPFTAILDSHRICYSQRGAKSDIFPKGLEVRIEYRVVHSRPSPSRLGFIFWVKPKVESHQDDLLP